MEVKAFTLVELIVVIAILAILGTLGFISFQGYSVSARDSVRIGDVRVIEKGLTLEQAKGNSLPLPDDKIDITVSGSLVSHQGYAGVGMLANLRQAGDIVDPLLKEPYTYMVTSPRKNFQLLAFMEKVHSSTYPFVAHAYASSYTDLFPKVFGESLGILLDANDLSPLQKKIIPDNELEIFSNSHLYTSYISDTQNITGTGGKLISGAVSQIVQAQDLLGSCQEIYETYPMSHNVDGNYVIDLDGSPLEVYCDMTTDGGGWTVIKSDFSFSYSNAIDCVDIQIISHNGEKLIKKTIASLGEIIVETDIEFNIQADDSKNESTIYAIDSENGIDYDIYIGHGADNTRILLEESKKNFKCLGSSSSNRCGVSNKPSINMITQDLILKRLYLQPTCNGSTAINANSRHWSRNRYFLSGTYYKVRLR